MICLYNAVLFQKQTFPKLFPLTLQTVTPVSNKIRNKILTKPMHSAGTRVHQSNKSNYLINIHLEQMPLATQVLKSTSPTYSRMLIYMILVLHAHKHCATWVKAITMHQNHYTWMTEGQKPPTTSLKHIFHKTIVISDLSITILQVIKVSSNHEL